MKLNWNFQRGRGLGNNPLEEVQIFLELGDSTLQTLHSESNFFEKKNNFFCILLLSSFCFKFVQVFITWYLIVSIKETLILCTTPLWTLQKINLQFYMFKLTLLFL